MRLQFWANLTPRNKTVMCIPGLFHQLGSDRKAIRIKVAPGSKHAALCFLSSSDNRFMGE